MSLTILKARRKLTPPWHLILSLDRLAVDLALLFTPIRYNLRIVTDIAIDISCYRAIESDTFVLTARRGVISSQRMCAMSSLLN